MPTYDWQGKNVPLLESRFNEFIDLSDSVQYTDFSVKKSTENIYNLYLKDDQNNFYPVYDEVDPLKGMESVLSQVRTFKGNIICILGLGLCHSIVPLVEAAGDDNTIVFFESNPVLFKKAMELFDFQAVLMKENVRFVVGKSPDLYKLLSTEKDKLYAAIDIKIIEFNNITSADKGWYQNIGKKIENFSIKENADLQTVSAAGKFFFKNRFDNLLMLADAKPLESLTGVYTGKSAILVAAGPSLSKNINQLLDVKKKALIIAADSAVAPLVNKGIIPDYIVSIDFRDFTYEKLAAVSDLISESCLIILAEASPKIPRYIKFKEIYYATQTPFVCKMLDNILGDNTKLPLLDISSVFHLAMVSAQIFGCSLIVFTGLDLGFSGAQDHVEGAVLNWGNGVKENSDSIYVEGVDGQPVHTLPVFIAIKEICEQLISSVPGLRYIDATEGGAKVQGTEIDKLINVINGLDEKKTIQPIEQMKNKSDYRLVLTRLESLKKKLLSLNRLVKQYDSHKKSIQKYFKNTNNFVVLPPKLENSIHKMDTITTRLNDDETMSYAKELLTEYYEEYFQHEKKKLEGGTTKENSLIINLKQQIFVQKIRKKAIDAFLEFVNQQIEIFTGLNRLEGETKSDSKESQLKLGEYYYQNEFLSRAEEIFVEIDGLPESDFYLGCINTKRGQIEKAKFYFEKAVLKKETLKKKIDDFISSTIHSLLRDNSEQNVATKSVMKKILKIDPHNLKAYEFLQNIHMNQVRELIIENKLDEAEIKLSSLCNPELEFRFDFKCMSLLVLLYFQSGKYEKISGILKNASELQNMKKEFSIWCSHWINRLECLRTGRLMGDNLEQLGLWVRDATENTGFVQIIWAAIWRKNVERILMLEKTPGFLINVSKVLDKWGEIKELIPDWYAVKALQLRNSGDLPRALQEIDMAIKIEKNTITNYQGMGDLQYIKAMVYSEMKNYFDALYFIREALKIRVVIRWWVFEKLLRLKINKLSESDVNLTCMKTLLVTGGELIYLGQLTKLNKKKKLFSLLTEINLSCTSPANGQHLVYAYSCIKGDRDRYDDLVNSVKNIVFDGHLKLDRTKTPILSEFLNGIWAEEVARIKEDNVNDYESVINNWAYLFEFLENWDLFKAEQYIRISKTAEAIKTLDSSFEKNRNNIAFLKLYVLQLFSAGRADDAIVVFNELTSIEPSEVSLLKDVGDNYAAVQDYNSALTVYEECLVLMPENTEVLFSIGELYYRTTKMEAALLAYETLLLTVPDHEPSIKRLMEIKNIHSGVK